MVSTLKERFTGWGRLGGPQGIMPPGIFPVCNLPFHVDTGLAT